jgi:TrmH family RNA methyltransferase
LFKDKTPMITSTDNQTVKEARALQEPKGRREQGRFLVEGVRLIEEAIRAGTHPALVFFLIQARENPRVATLLESAAARGASIVEVAPKVLSTLTDTVTSQGLIAVVPIPRVSPPPHPSFNLVLDQVRDPGNVGTILRGAEAAGADQVILTPGSVDPWSPKVVRSAMGAHFRLPVHAARTWEAVGEALKGAPVWLTDVRGATAYDEVDWTGPFALVVGGEAAGLTPEAWRQPAGRVAIPMAHAVESLNAAMAATICMFEAARQRRRQMQGNHER